MADASIQPLEKFGDFEIVGELGRGGMGVVYEARQVSLKRRVALKVLSGRMGLTPRAITRFKLEAEAAARLHHSNIVPIFATGEQDGIPFYAMEFIDGPSLDRIIRQMRLTRRGPPADGAATRPQAVTPGTVEAITATGGPEHDTEDPAINWSVETIIGRHESPGATATAHDQTPAEQTSPEKTTPEPTSPQPTAPEQPTEMTGLAAGDLNDDATVVGDIPAEVAATVVEKPDVDEHARTAEYIKVSGSGIGETNLARRMVSSSPSDSMLFGSSGSGASLHDQSLSTGSRYFRNIARMLADVADALQHAHDAGIIHRDIKPGNMLLSRDGRLCLNDFGLVRVMDAPGVTVSGEFVGSPLYMSPEQIVTGRQPIDHRTDIYSLGATLYELMTLQPPFVGTRRDEILTQILTKEPRDPRSLNRKIPADLETICLTALDKDPDRRYPTAAAMAADLRRFVAFEPIHARRAGLGARLLKWAQRRPAVAALSCALIVLVLSGGVFGFRAYQDNRAAQKLIAENQRQAARDKLERERQQQRRVAEEADKQRAASAATAIEAATREALNGTYDRIEEHLREAEFFGAHTGEVHLLRGLAAFESGAYGEAIEHLELAVSELPDSVAARVLLMRSCLMMAVSREDLELAVQMNREFRQMTPVTRLDQLYGGSAMTGTDPLQAIEMLRELEQQESSPAVQYMLGRAYFARVVQTYLRTDLEAGFNIGDMLRLIDAARATQPDNVLAMRRQVLAHFYAADIFRLAGFQEEQRQNLFTAQETAREMLIEFPEDAKSYQVNSLLAAFDGQWDFALKYARDARLRAHSRDDLADVTSFLHRAGRTAEALYEVDKNPGSRQDQTGIYRCFLIADCEGVEQALNAYQEWLAAVNPDAPPDRGVSVFGLFCYLGRPEEAIEQTKQFQRLIRTDPPTDSMSLQVEKFTSGLIGIDELVASAETRQDRINAHYLAGLSRLGHGDRAGAVAHFEAVGSEGFPAWGLDVFDLSKGAAILLNRLREDPKWPPWITKNADDK
ncbi:MAG: protein kinase [Planctomycetaceae bacterium]